MPTTDFSPDTNAKSAPAEVSTQKPRRPSSTDPGVRALIPLQLIDKLRAPRPEAGEVKGGVFLEVNRAVVDVLERGIQSVVNERDIQQLNANSYLAQLRRVDEFLEIYIAFVRNIAGAPIELTASQVRDAASELLALMW